MPALRSGLQVSFVEVTKACRDKAFDSMSQARDDKEERNRIWHRIGVLEVSPHPIDTFSRHCFNIVSCDTMLPCVLLHGCCHVPCSCRSVAVTTTACPTSPALLRVFSFATCTVCRLLSFCLLHNTFYMPWPSSPALYRVFCFAVFLCVGSCWAGRAVLSSSVPCVCYAMVLCVGS